MLKTLKFVQGAIAKQDFVPALTHFRICNGKIKGFNGTLGICSPIAIDLDVAPRAAQFVRAIAACKEEISLHVADNGKLCVRSGKFKTFVECADKNEYPDIEPVGRNVELGKNFIPVLQKLEPFIAEDQSRPWACGVLFDGESAYATNNIVFVESWLGYKITDRVNIPAAAIRELVRIEKAPTRMQMTDTHIVFHYDNGAWLSTQLLTQPWPDVSATMVKLSPKGCKKAPSGLWNALEQLLPFTDSNNAHRCFMLGGSLSTTHRYAEVSGTTVEVPGLPANGIYNAKRLLSLKDVAACFNFDAYPSATPFFGENTRGLIVGIRS